MLKQKIGIFSILFIICALLTACGDNDAYSAASEAHDCSDDVSVQSFESEYTVPDYSEPDNGKNEILRLVADDFSVIRLIVSGDIYDGEDTGFEYVPLGQDSDYRDFSAVEALLDSVYSSESDVPELFLSYPTPAGPTVKSVAGVTNVSTAYAPEFTTVPNPSAATFVSYSTYRAELRVPCSDGCEYTYHAVFENGEWRLENSLFFMSGGNDADTWLQSGLEKGQNEGSAKRLTGNCLVVNIFIDDRASSWDDVSISRVLGFMDDTATFLESEAARYGAELTLESTDKNGSVYLKTQKNLPTSIDDYLWIELLFAETTYRTLEGCVRAYYDLDGYDNWCVMLHVAKGGRSYSLACNSSYYDYQIYYSERSVMFYSADTSYSYYSVASVYAHELLHLFGASDLYNDFIDEQSAKLLEHFYPNAIMRVTPDDIGMAAVCPYTAYRVGWISEITKPFDRINKKQ